MDDLLDYLAGCGLSVHPGAEPGALLLRGTPAALAEHRTPAVMAQLAVFKPQLLVRFGPEPIECPECGCEWYLPEAAVRELVGRGPWFCEKGPSRGGYTRANGKGVPGYDGCPYRDPEGR